MADPKSDSSSSTAATTSSPSPQKSQTEVTAATTDKEEVLPSTNGLKRAPAPNEQNSSVALLEDTSKMPQQLPAASVMELSNRNIESSIVAHPTNSSVPLNSSSTADLLSATSALHLKSMQLPNTAASDPAEGEKGASSSPAKISTMTSISSSETEVPTLETKSSMNTHPASTVAVSALASAGSFVGDSSSSPAVPPPPPEQPPQKHPIKKRKRSQKKQGGGGGTPSSVSTGRWTLPEHQAFLAGMAAYGREWKRVAMHIPTRTSSQVRSHAQKYFCKLQAAVSASAVAAAADRAGTTSATMGPYSSSADAAYSSPYDHQQHQHPQDQQQLSQQPLSASVRANVERILAQPESVQAEVDETLLRLRERYLVLQQRLQQQPQRQQNRRDGEGGGGGGGGGDAGGSVHDSSIESYNSELQDSELIALHVLQGGLEQSSASSTSASSYEEDSEIHGHGNAAVGEEENSENLQQEEEGPNPQAPPSNPSKKDATMTNGDA